MNNNITIRKYVPSDLDRLYEICLLTGKSGKDASEMYKDKKLLGHYYAAPYAVFRPELIYIAAINDLASGYIIGTKNSIEFSKKCELEWFPKLRQLYSLQDNSEDSNDNNIIQLIHKGYNIKKELLDYPAHLHIDLLPALQGKGVGKKLMNVFIENLKTYDVPALHLEVGKTNKGAIEFYKKIGFHLIVEYEFSIAFGMKF